MVRSSARIGRWSFGPASASRRLAAKKIAKLFGFPHRRGAGEGLADVGDRLGVVGVFVARGRWKKIWIGIRSDEEDPVSYTHLTLPTICSV